jgi:hypothetical protein
MKIIKERTWTMSAVNDERQQVLPSKVIWDGTIDRFVVFRNNIEGHYGQIGAGCLFDLRFQEAYLERGVDCYVHFLDEVPSASQNKKDTLPLLDALLSACQSGLGFRILMEIETNRLAFVHGVSWYNSMRQKTIDMSRSKD